MIPPSGPAGRGSARRRRALGQEERQRSALLRGGVAWTDWRSLGPDSRRARAAAPSKRPRLDLRLRTLQEGQPGSAGARAPDPPSTGGGRRRPPGLGRALGRRAAPGGREEGADLGDRDRPRSFRRGKGASQDQGVGGAPEGGDAGDSGGPRGGCASRTRGGRPKAEAAARRGRDTRAHPATRTPPAALLAPRCPPDGGPVRQQPRAIRQHRRRAPAPPPRPPPSRAAPPSTTRAITQLPLPLLPFPPLWE